jgi:hypothetical protein
LIPTKRQRTLTYTNRSERFIPLKRNTLTIHMGASRFTVTIHKPAGDDVFDINAMTPQQRGKFFGAFRAGVSQMMGAR